MATATPKPTDLLQRTNSIVIGVAFG